MRRGVIWLLAGALAAGLTVLAFLPAAWLAPLVESRTQGRLTLGDPQGTLWNGSAFLGGAAAGDAPVAPLLPGRFRWRISPLILVGRIDATLENPAALSQPVRIDGSWWRWQVGPSSVILPAERLAGLGAPFNTIQPTGRMRLSWNTLSFVRDGRRVDAIGALAVELTDVASRLSPVRPLGGYTLTVDLHGQEADIALRTARGPMLLAGRGTLRNGHLKFSGTAQAAAGQEERLANFLNLLGQRRKEGDKTVIGLEFRS